MKFTIAIPISAFVRCTESCGRKRLTKDIPALFTVFFIKKVESTEKYSRCN